MTATTGQLAEMYRRMLRIRLFEETVQQMAARGELPGSIHLSIGQEAQIVGACMALNDHDYITGNHRSHGHPIGKNASLRGLMAEILGRSTGVCRGKGGSMHLADFSVGSLGESAIIAGGVPVATGAALSAKLTGNGRISLAFFGDGGANQGVLYESMNMAAVWRLPVIFLCENNQYASLTPLGEVTGHTRIADRAHGFGLPGVRVEDGQDVEAVFEAVATAAERARAGTGPTLVEVLTYRYRDHSEGLRFRDAYAGARRDDQEIAAWQARDPINLAAQRLRGRGVADEEIAAIDAEVRGAIDDCVDFAQNSPLPEAAAAFDDLYTDRTVTAPAGVC
ncbi:thiamine pyrophosphate-dependent dehydrogenase E1 component subunit alpha [Mycolicibacter longobardus]|uniref:Pyruvate dehydrogenase (Acetyl-transferring) E1 component subunit alpha n=1 Tax=Mycolicibacter longobardus TaxID=1108812 RepID=A0A1X1YRL7_9MYCO|nr:thiamine pyrophosphate-dependent dehydrogenase E1 component subunit alpha [Mycolicibacter longobardus]ORW13767.1 pyruvate dehydrogenase (acetyl-transferring) E1 component subunit alpha [Mycolicibacter longobardus]